ncbi:MAG: hypothetical protein UZ18_ATM001001860 [Armatimonadetes bacterium OLB18]|nr:MAG: hypothetical protein UZ18_ATM001001860 [Armatimonadetes bacterium OLB18]
MPVPLVFAPILCGNVVRRVERWDRGCVFGHGAFIVSIPVQYFERQGEFGVELSDLRTVFQSRSLRSMTGLLLGAVAGALMGAIYGSNHVPADVYGAAEESNWLLDNIMLGMSAFGLVSTVVALLPRPLYALSGLLFGSAIGLARTELWARLEVGLMGEHFPGEGRLVILALSLGFAGAFALVGPSILRSMARPTN